MTGLRYLCQTFNFGYQRIARKSIARRQSSLLFGLVYVMMNGSFANDAIGWRSSSGRMISNSSNDMPQCLPQQFDAKADTLEERSRKPDQQQPLRGDDGDVLEHGEGVVLNNAALSTSVESHFVALIGMGVLVTSSAANSPEECHGP